ncbi:MAG: hypothetical protein EZS28_024276 [Streblomastix strix]|uniref:Uncharacterized protein n=1 Tax=Streblomastix strix TaxID=222440 RepID=A0A5J4VCA7_9EUKA|nr:MAG: hypothetical protein EZS28_024276 [Streblomastix strix]
MTYCASILAVLGKLHIIVDRARQAKREGKEYGGSFLIFGESDMELEEKDLQEVCIAIVSANEKVPASMSYDQMINIRGVVFAFPEFALYMDGKLLWQRNIPETSGIQSSSSSSSQSTSSVKSQLIPQTVKQPLSDKWTQLCVQLDMQTKQRIAKFFVGANMAQQVEVGISGMPTDIKLVVLSSGKVRTTQYIAKQRKGQEIQTLIPWSINDEQNKDVQY